MIEGNDARHNEQGQQNARDDSGQRTVTISDALLDRHWDKAAVDQRLQDTHRVITRDQLQDAMGEAALANAAATGPVGPHKDVTRFLLHPDFKVTHPGLDFDLVVTRTSMVGDGLLCDCTRADGEGGRWPFMLAELFPSGPMTESARLLVKGMTKAITEDWIAKLVESGVLKKPPADLAEYQLPKVATGDSVTTSGTATDAILSTGEHIVLDGQGGGPFTLPETPGVHHLQVHPEYVMEPGGTGTKPAKHD